MALGFSATLRNNRLDEIAALLDAGAGQAKIKIYDGTRPATGGTATTLLATLLCTDPVAPAASGGVLTFSSITSDTNVDATSTATWFRMTDSVDTFVLDGDVGTSGSDINFDSVSFVAGGTAAISSLTFTDGNP